MTKILIACFLLVLVSACTGQSSNATAASAEPSATQQHAPVSPVSSLGTLLVQSQAVDSASAKPTPLATGQTISGVINLEKSGKVLAFDAQIGNYHNTSDGALTVKLCEGDTCSTGSASLAGSADNQFLEIPLRRPIEAVAGRAFHFTVTRTAGNKPLAVWTYSDPAAATVMPDGAKQPRVLKTGLRYKSGSVLLLSIAIAGALLLLVWLVWRRLSFRTVVVAGMFLAAGLILAVIIVSNNKPGLHPDEVSHIAAYQYYVDHVLPPAVNSPATVPSTSAYGFSYLFTMDVVYDIAARVTGPVRAWTLNNDFLAGRLFQFGLWSILCILAMCRRHWAAVLCVTLLTPQVWYLFSYFNADAFPLFLALVVAGLVSDRRSGVHEFLRSGELRRLSLWVAVLCTGLLLVSKSNYLPLIPAFMLWLAALHLELRARFVGLALAALLAIGVAHMLKGVLGGVPVFASWYLPIAAAGYLVGALTVVYVCWQWWMDMRARRIMFRVVAFVLMCAAVALPRVAWDVHVNGWPAQKAAQIQTVENERARPAFKPSTIAQGAGRPTMGMASRGVSLRQVAFSPHHWVSTSLKSAFGVYGYMSVFAPAWMYFAMFLCAGLFAGVALYPSQASRSRNWGALVVIVLGCAILILASSLLFSWTFDFEPQGRYLLPILPLIALLVGHDASVGKRRALAVLTSAAFILSVGSFCFVALPAFI